MTTDIEQRLREEAVAADESSLDFVHYTEGALLIEAADEIAQLRKERDEARTAEAYYMAVWKYECEKHSEWLEKSTAAESRASNAEAELALVREALERRDQQVRILARRIGNQRSALRAHYRNIEAKWWQRALPFTNTLLRRAVEAESRARSLQPGGKE